MYLYQYIYIYYVGVFYTYRPFGLPHFNVFILGVDIIMVAGSGMLINCNWVNFQLFLSLAHVGGPVALLGE